MILFWKQYKEYSVITLLACFGVALIWFGIIPLYQKIKDQMNTSQEILTEREMRDALVVNMSHILEQRDLVEKKESQLNTVISKGSIVDMIKYVEALAKETDTAIVIKSNDPSFDVTNANKSKKNSVSAEGKDEGKTLLESLPSERRLMVIINLTGKYNNIVRFIQKLEAMPYETDIVTADLSVSQPTALSGQSRTNMFASGDSSIPSLQNPTTPSPNQSKEELPVQATLNTVVYVNEE